jgi:hypothetical protein
MLRIAIITLLLATIATPLLAQNSDGEPGQPQTFEEAMTTGKVDFNIRLRAEIVEQDGLDGAQAFTERIRLGYGTRSWQGLSFYIDMEDIRTADDDRYNAAGLNANGGKAVVADPQDSELNQAYAKYVYDWATFIVGRQRMILDDARFVGNVGWRQNEQTFDAITLKGAPCENVSFLYSHVKDVNRIFGHDSGRDFESSSHLFNVSYADIPVAGKLTAFSYILDFDNGKGLSSDTFGVRLAGKNDVDEGLSLGHTLSWATQSDNSENPTDYTADYYLVEANLAKKGLGQAGAGYEVLASDSNKAAFSTPLATLHKFNGFADVFLTTPAGGLDDFYVFAGTTLPCDIKGKVIFHWFKAEDSGGDYGEELDIVASKKLSKRAGILAKIAYFDGNAAFSDRTKAIVQWEYKF